MERGCLLHRTSTEWVDARSWAPDTDRVVIALVPNKAGKLRAVQVRWSGGKWRYLTAKDQSRTKRGPRVWMDIPWWDSREQKNTNEANPTASPAGAKARVESEAEAQAEVWSDRAHAREETGLTQAETDFED